MSDLLPVKWRMLLLSLPGRQAALRVRTWRRLKAAGAATLRDGVHLMPDEPRWTEVLEAVAAEVRAAGGEARLIRIEAPYAEFGPLFDRSADYAALLSAVAAAAKDLGPRRLARARKALQELRREFEGLVAGDPLPGATSAEAAAALDALQAAINSHADAGEPRAASGKVRRRDPRDFRGRCWATRSHPGIDRLASAWLIRRFIDADATFRWLRAPARQRPEFVGFDFDGATFTHVGDRVTFETLLQAFGLESDPALLRIGAMVHYLDAGGIPVPEAGALGLMVGGLRQRLRGADDAMLAEASRLFDDLYAGLAGPGGRP